MSSLRQEGRFLAFSGQQQLAEEGGGVALNWVKELAVENLGYMYILPKLHRYGKNLAARRCEEGGCREIFKKKSTKLSYHHLEYFDAPLLRTFVDRFSRKKHNGLTFKEARD